MIPFFNDNFLGLKLYVALAVIGGVYGLVWRFVRTRISDNWVQIQGTVESSQVRILQQQDKTLYAAELAYSYTVGGEFYGGNHKVICRSEEAADAMVHAFPAKTAVTIRSHPRHPERSMFREDDNQAVVAVGALLR